MILLLVILGIVLTLFAAGLLVNRERFVDAGILVVIIFAFLWFWGRSDIYVRNTEYYDDPDMELLFPDSN